MICSNNILSIYLGVILGMIIYYIFKPFTNPRIVYIGDDNEKYEYNKYIINKKLKTIV
jgi:hypothetical protein